MIRLTLARQVKTVSSKSLLIDIDGKKPDLKHIRNVLRIVEIKANRIRKDKTKHGWHVIVYLNRKLTPIETIALQAICGSDLVREAMNFSRLRKGLYRNLLFQPKGKEK